MMTPRIALIGLGIIIAFTAPRAQQPAFDSVTVVSNSSGATARSMFRLMPDGSVKAVNVTVLDLVQRAYQRHAFDRPQVEGGPSWLSMDRFDVEARATGGHEFDADSFPRQTSLKLQRMLEAQFKLRVRTDSRSTPVYELRLRSSGELGPRLRKVDVDCGAEMKKKTPGEAAEGLQRGRPVCAAATYAGRLTADALTMPALAGLLSGMLDRPVIDRTGLKGAYEFEVEAAEIEPMGPVGPSNRPSQTTQSIFAAMPEQLGLELHAAPGSIEVLVIESAERPR